jgi:hypothetical protein
MSEPAPAPAPALGAETITADVASQLLAAVTALTTSVKETQDSVEETKKAQQTQENTLTTLTSNLTQAVGTIAALTGSVTQLQNQPAAGAKKEEENPADLLPYVPYFDARDENPHAERPHGVTDRPQLYALNEAASPTYSYLRKKKNAAYHELGTTAPLLSYQWDSNFYFKEKLLGPLKELLAADGSELSKDLDFGLDAYLNSIEEQYAIANRRKNLLELRARIESDSPQFTPSDADKKLWESMSKAIGGWEQNLGVDSSIDPMFRKLLEEYHKTAHNEQIKALAKSGAGASKRPARNSPKKTPGSGAGGSAGEGS